eukprot:365205-Chlamydomonas_euryale.AAC.1
MLQRGIGSRGSPMLGGRTGSGGGHAGGAGADIGAPHQRVAPLQQQSDATAAAAAVAAAVTDLLTARDVDVGIEATTADAGGSAGAAAGAGAGDAFDGAFAADPDAASAGSTRRGHRDSIDTLDGLMDDLDEHLPLGLSDAPATPRPLTARKSHEQAVSGMLAELDAMVSHMNRQDTAGSGGGT